MGNFGRNNAGGLGTMIGTGMGAALAPFSAGLSLPVGASIGGSLGGTAGGMMGPDSENLAQQPNDAQAQHRQAQLQLLQALMGLIGQPQQVPRIGGGSVGNPTPAPPGTGGMF